MFTNFALFLITRTTSQSSTKNIKTMGHLIMMNFAKTIGELKEAVKRDEVYTVKFFTCGYEPDRRYPFHFDFGAREIGEGFSYKSNRVERWSECPIELRDDTPILGYQVVDQETAYIEYGRDFRNEWDLDNEEEYDNIQVLFVMLPKNYEQFKK